MKLARTIGTVTLSQAHPAMKNTTLRCIEIVDKIERVHEQPLGGETIVAWDLCGSRVGDLVALAEGPEAAQPLKPDIVPIDASIVALLDDVELG